MSSSLARAALWRLGGCSTRHISSTSLHIDGIDSASTISSSHKTNSSSHFATHSQSPPHAIKTRGSYKEEKLKELSQALTSASGTPSQVWSQYVNATNLLGLKTIPLEIHRQVLRKCTPSFQELRKKSAFMISRDPTASPHHLEARLQAVIRNIRAVGGTPSKTDYHFVLEQFAAVGHYGGSMQVLKEMLYMNISPQYQTYFLCLQAIAHRLTLPEDAAIIGQRATQVRKLLTDLMTDMSLRKVLFTSVTVDLCARILKDAGDIEGFESLLKVGYGIDISNPDHLPLEALGLEIPSLSIKNVEPRNFFPLSTSGLNTIIDMYGRQRNISKLVQAFEVLTSPLPKSSNSTGLYPSSFDDDDDFGVFDMDTSPPLPSLSVPSASPNTTSLAYIIRHVCHADHIPLARHYLLLAMDYEKNADEATRIALASKPLPEVAAQSVSVDGHMIASLLGVANRNKRRSLMRWIRAQISTIIERKQEALSFYTSFRAQNRRREGAVPVGDDKAEMVGEEADPSVHTQSNSEDDILPVSFTTTAASQPFKPIHLDTHILILKNDISDLTEMQSYTAWLLGKVSERVKDRLGRRVREGKDIYSTSAEERGVISPKRWSKRVVHMISKEAEGFSRTRELDRQSSEEGEGLRKSMHWKTREDFFTSRRS